MIPIKATQPRTKPLANSQSVKGFTHQKGAHCESKSLQDVLCWAGFPISEAMAFGLDASMGFTFIDTSPGTSGMVKDLSGGIPFFVGGKQGTLNASSLACRVLGATCDEQTYTSADRAWAVAQTFLDKGQPLAIFVDMFYLPYHSTFHQLHFGRHAVALAGWDQDRQVALVADVEFNELQEIPLADLKQARGSSYGGKYMSPQNTHVAITKRADGKHPPLAAGAKLAIQQVSKNMLAASVSYHGIQALERFARGIPQWSELLEGTMNDRDTGKVRSKAEQTLQMLHAYIEEYGTGGAIFRKLYRSFLLELCTLPEVTGSSVPQAWTRDDVQLVNGVIPILDQDITAWSDFAGQVKRAVAEWGVECLGHLPLEDLAAQVRRIAAWERDIFTRLSKLKI